MILRILETHIQKHNHINLFVKPTLILLPDTVRNTGTRAPNSQGGDVPDKYMVVTNNEMVRVKYLLVYVKKTITTPLSQQTLR